MGEKWTLPSLAREVVNNKEAADLQFIDIKNELKSLRSTIVLAAIGVAGSVIAAAASRVIW